MKIAAVSFLLAKVVFVGTAFCMLISDTAALISMCTYIFLVFSSVVLSLWEGFSKKRKSYSELEAEILTLKKLLELRQTT